MGRRVFRAVLLVLLVPIVLTGVWLANAVVERESELEVQRIIVLANERAAVLAVAPGRVPEKFAADLGGRYAVVLDKRGP